MYRTFAAAVAVAVVACGGGLPRAAADNPVCTSTWCTFLLPSRNISCEMDYGRGGIPNEIYCQTDSPPQTARLSTDGSFKTCTGESCLGNPGEGTATLAYGQTAAVGPFACRSEPSGVTCTITSGRGFTMSTAGVSAVG